MLLEIMQHVSLSQIKIIYVFLTKKNDTVIGIYQSTTAEY